VGGERRQHDRPGPPARGGGPQKGGPPAAQALGRSRGGLSTKIHLAVEGRGRPLALLLTGGQADDSQQLPALLGAVGVPRPGPGRPRSRPDRLLADKGYSYPKVRRLLRRRGLPHCMPLRAPQARARAHRPGRPPAFDPAAYRRRNVAERCVGRLKQFRALATRYEKTADAFLALVLFAAILLWTR
jgi:transposase